MAQRPPIAFISHSAPDNDFLIVGIRDDGHGKAQRFEPALVGDVQAIKREIMSLAQDHIRERITGIDAESRTIEGNPILIVRVPKTDSRPHAVMAGREVEFSYELQTIRRPAGT